VKHSDILSGPREVFRNVFCRRLEDILVHGMNTLYQDLTRIGLSGVHFVSNSPVSIYPLVSQFLQLHKFPSFYSLKLKMYSSRSIVTSLFEGAGDRKRPPIEDIMNEFGDSKFLMFGDSGEQDLELYVSLARERPKQVLAIFIRDVTSSRAEEARKVAEKAGLMSHSELAENESAKQRQEEHGVYASGNTYDRSPSPTSSGASTPTSTISRQPTDQDMKQTIADLQSLSAEEQKVLKRAAQWETRVNQALDAVPPGVKLIFFKEPEEIESVAQALVEANV
jgi:phosphatidate phosphatase APP1